MYVVYDNYNQIQGKYRNLDEIKEYFGLKSLYMAEIGDCNTPPIVIYTYGIDGQRFFAFWEDEESYQRASIFQGNR